MSNSVIRCAACARRIRDAHPHIGLIDLDGGQEVSYHAHPDCQRRGVQDMAALMKRGRLYILRHYHGAACPDEAPGFGCSGGCFDPLSEAAAAN
ncbi:MAG: hypothetical protein M3N18_06010 [Actinomycetota bacterium]|nr:hypothetical protein [Actinomycetota bacterium]